MVSGTWEQNKRWEDSIIFQKEIQLYWIDSYFTYKHIYAGSNIIYIMGLSDIVIIIRQQEEYNKADQLDYEFSKIIFEWWAY